MPKRPKRPVSVQQITGGPGPTVEAGGKTWRLGFNTQNAKARLEELVRSRVTRDALRLRREVGGEEGEQLWQDTRDSLAAGHYDTFGAGWLRVLKSSIGNALFVLSLLQKHHPEATEAEAVSLLASEPEQMEAALAVVASDFLTAVARQMATERGATPHEADKLAAELLSKATPAKPTGSG